MTGIIEKLFPDVAWDDSAGQTADRILGYWIEYRGNSEPDFSFTTFKAVSDQMIVVNDIEFSSMCQHHLLPIWGKAHVAYIPNALMVGLSKIPRTIDHFASRPQVQERLTSDVAKFLQEKLNPFGVAVVLEATHSCMACRGVKKHNGSMITSEMLGIFRDSDAARSEFLKVARLR